MPATKEDVISFIDNMTVLEMAGFVKELEAKYGVTAAVASVAAPAAASSAAPAEAKTEFAVELVNGGDKKIQVIKEVRTITNLGLKDAKDLVEGASEGSPKVLKESVKKEEADDIKKKIEAAGGTVKIK
ncbi:MAG: 50S ribosomal protein L7/L12 [Nitrospinae bacterium RIFCSPLOWO2_12_FULL_47_7]|nr:MAG: 50S ribosomal protein L7/L12 [Nitrospinae bacterium RIFCSPLOWO2_12_FULL_47_7]